MWTPDARAGAIAESARTAGRFLRSGSLRLYTRTREIDGEMA